MSDSTSSHAICTTLVQVFVSCRTRHEALSLPTGGNFSPRFWGASDSTSPANSRALARELSSHTAANCGARCALIWRRELVR